MQSDTKLYFFLFTIRELIPPPVAMLQIHPTSIATIVATIAKQQKSKMKLIMIIISSHYLATVAMAPK